MKAESLWVEIALRQRTEEEIVMRFINGIIMINDLGKYY